MSMNSHSQISIFQNNKLGEFSLANKNWQYLLKRSTSQVNNLKYFIH